MKTETGTDIKKAAEFLRRGELVAIPTETVYGLAGNALDEAAVLNIFKTKQRPSFDPLIVHVGKSASVENFVTSIPSKASALMQHFWPGPLTILLEKKDNISPLVTSGLDTVALRMPRHPLTLELLNSIPFPLAAPSANPFGYVSPVTAQHVRDQLDGKIAYILDGGPCQVGVESTIVGFEKEECVVYRPGGISLEALTEVAGPVRIQEDGSQLLMAPGMMKSHYAPTKPVYIGSLPDLIDHYKNHRYAVLCFTGEGLEFPTSHTRYLLSADGDPDEAARNLFSALREFDRSEDEVLLAEEFPAYGLGRAINDRLKKAAAKR